MNIIKVTLDTNVFVSGTYWKGDSYKILNLIFNREIDCYITPEILQEFSRVINYEEIIKKKTFSNALQEYSYIQSFLTKIHLISSKEKLFLITKDHDDNKILECAISGGVDYIITQDKHILDLKNIAGIIILTPAEFLKIFHNIDR